MQTMTGSPSIPAAETVKQPGDLENLLAEAGEFFETNKQLLKLKAVDKASDISSGLFAVIAVVLVSLFALFAITTGLALLIGDWLGKNFYGFFIVGALYGITGIVCYVNRERWLKEPMGSIVIKKLLK